MKRFLFLLNIKQKFVKSGTPTTMLYNEVSDLLLLQYYVKISVSMTFTMSAVLNIKIYELNNYKCHGYILKLTVIKNILRRVLIFYFSFSLSIFLVFKFVMANYIYNNGWISVQKLWKKLHSFLYFWRSVMAIMNSWAVTTLWMEW